MDPKYCAFQFACCFLPRGQACIRNIFSADFNACELDRILYLCLNNKTAHANSWDHFLKYFRHAYSLRAFTAVIVFEGPFFLLNFVRRMSEGRGGAHDEYFEVDKYYHYFACNIERTQVLAHDCAALSS